jgi:hypothetical protein
LQKNCTKSDEIENTFFIDTHTPNDFQMHQQSLDHSYCKRETSLTKLKNSKCDDFSGENGLTSSPKKVKVWKSTTIAFSGRFPLHEAPFVEGASLSHQYVLHVIR